MMDTENLLRELAPRVLGVVTRRFHDFAAAEDAVQEALLAASLQWPREGVPDNPRGWLIQVAGRRMMDYLRSEEARRRREELAAGEAAQLAPPVERQSGIGARRHADFVLHVLSSVADFVLRHCLDVAGCGRLDHGRNRQRLSGPRGDYGAAH